MGNKLFQNNENISLINHFQKRFVRSPHPLDPQEESMFYMHEKLSNNKYILKISTKYNLPQQRIKEELLLCKKLASCKNLFNQTFSITPIDHYIFEEQNGHCNTSSRCYILFNTLNSDPLSYYCAQAEYYQNTNFVMNEQTVFRGLLNLIEAISILKHYQQPHLLINSQTVYYVKEQDTFILADPEISKIGNPQQQYYSPERLLEMRNLIQNPDPYLSDLFSIGVVGLKVLGYNVSQFYSINKSLDLHGMKQLVLNVKNQKLRILLSRLITEDVEIRQEQLNLSKYSEKSNSNTAAKTYSKEGKTRVLSGKVSSVRKNLIKNSQRSRQQQNRTQSQYQNFINTPIRTTTAPHIIHFNNQHHVNAKSQFNNNFISPHLSQINEHNEQPIIEVPNILPPQRIVIEEKKHLFNNHFQQIQHVQHVQPPRFVYHNNPTQNHYIQKVISPVPSHKMTYFDQPKGFTHNSSLKPSLSDLSINKSHSNTMITLTNQTQSRSNPQLIYNSSQTKFDHPLEIQRKAEVIHINNEMKIPNSQINFRKTDNKIYQASPATNITLSSPATGKNNNLNREQKLENQDPMKRKDFQPESIILEEDRSNFNKITQQLRMLQSKLTEVISASQFNYQKGPSDFNLMGQSKHAQSQIVIKQADSRQKQSSLIKIDEIGQKKQQISVSVQGQKLSPIFVKSQEGQHQQSSQINDERVQQSFEYLKINSNINSNDNNLQDIVKTSIKKQQNQNFQDLNTPLKNPNIERFEANNLTIPEESDEQSVQSHQSQARGEYVEEVYQNGGKYVGYMVDGARYGQGIFYYKDGGYYDGKWKNNMMNGYGRLYYQTGELAYQGQWYQDQFHGRGTVYNDQPIQIESEGFNYKNMNQSQSVWVYYQGDLLHDMKDRFGKLMLSNGEYYEGQFKKDLVHGKGIFRKKDGSIIKGLWQEGILARQF